MLVKKKIFAIPGSTRQQSANHNLLKAVASIFQHKMEINIFEELALLPAFNPGDTEKDIPSVSTFRQQVREADGVIICTPEYAHGVPGALKNAIDWTVSSNEFYNKSTVLITASTDGTFGHSALLEILRTIGTKNTDRLQLLIQFAQTKISTEGTITDTGTYGSVKNLLDDFLNSIDEQDT